jgi:hypothetical protein
MNIYGDVTDQMTTTSSKVAQLAFPSNAPFVILLCNRTGATGGAAVRFYSAGTEEPGPHSRDSQFALEVRNVEAGHTDAGQSDWFSDGHRCV